MKIRMIALAGVAALALSTPAVAAEGWYLGLGAGWDMQNGVQVTSVTHVPTFSTKDKSSNGAIIAGSVGYVWDNGIRLEDEVGWTGHDLKNSAGARNGYSAITTDMVNLVWDIPLDENWKLSLGGGIGAGAVRTHMTLATAVPPGGTADLVNGTRVGLAFQGIAGIAYSLSDDVDLFVDYRYRSVGGL
jgi:opacity protein-like surface antigen